MTAPGRDYQISSTYFGGSVRVYEELNLLTADALEKLGAELREAIRSPYAQAWWSGKTFRRIGQVLFEVHGDAVMEEVGYRVAKSATGPIIRPLVAMIGALFGLSPGSLFTRVAALTNATIRGVPMRWIQRGPRSGTFAVVYPPPIAPAQVPLWRGSIRFVFELAGVEGTIAQIRIENDETMVADVSW
jgi:hypothetical protein